MKKLLFLLLLSLFHFISLGQDTTLIDSLFISNYQIQPDDPIVVSMDSMLQFYKSIDDNFEADTGIKILRSEIPQFSDEEIKKKLDVLDQNTPFSFNFNSVTREYIRLYEKRRTSVSIFLARKETYFPIFEEMLLKYKLPVEFKYLPIVESALKPDAESWAGAAGLWQFMYNTGKRYGLKADSYMDLRRDPYKATEAACKHLTRLYKVYGNWELVLAAYNAGGGNVNKAIRKSGGKRTYWEIFQYLPRETRGYVPAFVAINYMMSHAEDYLIYPKTPLAKYNEIDTFRVTERVDFIVASKFLEIPVEYLQFINPAFYNGVIPKNDKSYTLYVPSQKTGLFTLNEESIYNLSKEVKKTYNLASISAPRGNGKKIKYRVKSGDYLGKIANKYDCKVSDIKRWNNLRGNSLDIGQLLVIYTKKKSAKSETKIAKRSDKVPELKAGESYLLYTIKEGDNLWDIAKLFPEVSVEDILNHNRAINKDNLKPGKKIKIIQYD